MIYKACRSGADRGQARSLASMGKQAKQRRSAGGTLLEMSWEVGDRETDLQTVIRGRLFVFSAFCFRELRGCGRGRVAFVCASLSSPALSLPIWVGNGHTDGARRQSQICFFEGSILWRISHRDVKEDGRQHREADYTVQYSSKR